MNESIDIVDELGTVGIGLSSQKSDKNKDNDVIDNIRWVFNDAITDEEDGSKILETV